MKMAGVHSARRAVATACALVALLCGGQVFAREVPLSPTARAAEAAIGKAHLAEPLVRSAPTSVAEDEALARAVGAYERRSRPDDLSALTAFLEKYPHSGWAAALQTNLGLAYVHDGYLSRAIDAWKAAWGVGQSSGDPRAKAVVDRAVGELVHLYASLGQFDNASAVFEQIGTRPISGSATELVQVAREQISLLTIDPKHLFNCGPIALQITLRARAPQDSSSDFLTWYRANNRGTNLKELVDLSAKAGKPYRIVQRSVGQPVPELAVVHFKVGHFGAIVGKANGRYHVEDAAFPSSGLWLTQEALDAETSGFYLVPVETPNDKGWREVAAAEGADIWGKGGTSGVTPGGAGDPRAKGKGLGGWPGLFGGLFGGGGGAGGAPCPMCEYDIKEAAVGLTLSDVPVGYKPAFGPSAKVRITYNQREDSQPANFAFYNLGPKWTLDWLTYIVDDPTNAGATVSRYLSDGGAVYYSGYNSGTGTFATTTFDNSVLTLTAQSPVSYKRTLPDGSVEIYGKSDGAISYPRRVFLTQIIDPQGNAVTLNYDAQLRLTSLTDATARQTTFSYGLVNQPLLVTKITDPFGRSASLGYDNAGRLLSITDVLGLTSNFTYDANSLVNSMTTPYGRTTFAYTAPGSSGPPRFLDITDPLGYHEREEWLEPAPIPTSDPAATVPQGMPITLTNQYLEYRDSFYWDKVAYAQAGCTPTGGCDYTKARDRHFTHPPLPYTAVKSTLLESEKKPLENRVWYTYPGQSLSYFGGSTYSPNAAGRVLDDGSTQLTQASYDASNFYVPTQMIDPLGRTLSMTYVNQIDVSQIKLTTAPGVQTTVQQYTYNTHHQPLTHIDAAGKTWTFTYNSVGQLATTTNPLSQTTTLNYDGLGNLTSVTNANSVTQASYTYDALARVSTFTDSQGWTATYAYDAFDRVTSITYPDGTSKIYTYDRLDLSTYRDRLGRTWSYAYDANRRLTGVTDPAGKQTLLAYNGLDELTALTDNLGRTTSWAYDLQGRLTTKTYADNSVTTRAYETTTSRLKSVTDPLSQVKQYSYAKDDRLLGIAYAGALQTTPNVTYAYDAYFPRLTSRADGAGTTSFSYVPVGTAGALRLQQENTPIASVNIAFGYDDAGRVTSRAVTGATTETFHYDALGRLDIDTNDLGTWNIAYLGQTAQILSRLRSGSTVGTTWSYLPNSGDRRLSQISSVGTVGTQTTSFQYTSDAMGEVTSEVHANDGSIYTPPTSLTQSVSYNTLNQISAAGSQAYTYDVNGNLTADGARTYTWDAENRLVGIAYVGQTGKSTTFSYDGLGRWVAIRTTQQGGGNAVTLRFVWCGAQLCQQRRDPNQNIERIFYEQGEWLPAVPSPASYFYGIDRLGSVRRLFGASGTPATDFDPYGTPLHPNQPQSGFTYAKQFNNNESGLTLALWRTYSPNTGRFLSRDPLGEIGDPNQNLYAYAGGMPTWKIDPLGLCGEPGGPGKRPCSGWDVASQTFKAGALIAGGVVVVGAVVVAAAPEAVGVGAVVTLGEVATLAGYGLSGASVVTDTLAGGADAGFASGLGALSDAVQGKAVESSLGSIGPGLLGTAKAAMEFAAGPDCVP